MATDCSTLRRAFTNGAQIPTTVPIIRILHVVIPPVQHTVTAVWHAVVRGGIEYASRDVPREAVLHLTNTLVILDFDAR